NCDSFGTGKNIHICAYDLIKVRDEINKDQPISIVGQQDLYTNPSYYQYYRIVNHSDAANGTNDPILHKALFADPSSYLSQIYDPFYISSIIGNDSVGCGSTTTDPCKTMKFVMTHIPDTNLSPLYIKGQSNVTVVILDDTSLEFDETINSFTDIGNRFVVKSSGFISGLAYYTKQQIQTSTHSQSLFKIQADSLLEKKCISFSIFNFTLSDLINWWNIEYQ
ncbi:MAG: hypothetical protein EZS28_051938, partial [Streblomastix strix]